MHYQNVPCKLSNRRTSLYGFSSDYQANERWLLFTGQTQSTYMS